MNLRKNELQRIGAKQGQYSIPQTGFKLGENVVDAYFQGDKTIYPKITPLEVKQQRHFKDSLSILLKIRFKWYTNSLTT